MISRCSGHMLVDDLMELVAMREGVVFRLLAFTWWVRAAKLCAWGRLFLMLGWLDTLFSLWWVVYEEALRVRDLRQFLALGIVTCVTWEGAGQRGTRVFRCLALWGTVPQPQSRSEPPRENQFPKRSPQPSGGVNPTYRKPAPQAASVPLTSGKSSAPVKGDALALVRALRGFGSA